MYRAFSPCCYKGQSWALYVYRRGQEAEPGGFKAVTRQEMEKRKITTREMAGAGEPDWLSLAELADVEVTSESAAHPIEAALLPGYDSGWVADAPGRQIIRLKFKRTLPLRQIRIVIEENEKTRTQEFVVRVAPEPNGPWRDVARQQFNFSPSGATRQSEDYRLDPTPIAALELVIVPDISGGDSRASLQQLRVA